MADTVEEPTTRPLNTYGIAAFVFVERNGALLTLKRAGGTGAGMWASPGGAKEHGESPEQAAVRELFEETGLVPSGPLQLITIAPLHIRGTDYIHCFYACECSDGEVVLNPEHSAYRWVDPVEHRASAYGDEIAELLKPNPPTFAAWSTLRDVFDQYLRWREHRDQCTAIPMA